MTHHRVQYHCVERVVGLVGVLSVFHFEPDSVCDPFCLGEALRYLDELGAVVRTDHQTREVRPRSDRPGHNAGSTAQLQHRVESVDGYVVEVTVCHFDESVIASAHFESLGDPIDRCRLCTLQLLPDVLAHRPPPLIRQCLGSGDRDEPEPTKQAGR